MSNIHHSSVNLNRATLYSKEADLLKKNSELRKAIRLKHLHLKNHTFQVKDDINESSKALITPLNKIASLKNISNSSLSEISNIPKSEQSIIKYSTPIKKNSLTPFSLELNESTIDDDDKNNVEDEINDRTLITDKAPRPLDDTVYHSVINQEDISNDISTVKNDNSTINDSVNNKSKDYTETIQSLLQRVETKNSQLDLALGVRKKSAATKLEIKI